MVFVGFFGAVARRYCGSMALAGLYSSGMRSSTAAYFKSAVRWRWVSSTVFCCKSTPESYVFVVIRAKASMMWRGLNPPL